LSIVINLEIAERKITGSIVLTACRLWSRERSLWRKDYKDLTLFFY